VRRLGALLLVAAGWVDAASAAPTQAATVKVEFLSKLAPIELTVTGPDRRVQVAARGGVLLVDGRPARGELHLPPASWSVAATGVRPRRVEGRLSIRAVGGVLRLVADLDLETYVAEVLASEAEPGTPPAALEALAVVVRSYAVAARDRHEGGALCDLAHCQVLRGVVTGPFLTSCRRAARATRGEVFLGPDGTPRLATFHAACGGHTASPRAAFGEVEEGPGAAGSAVEDPGCPPEPWRASLTPAQVAHALRDALGRASDPAAAGLAGQLRARDLVLRADEAGWVSQVSSAAGAWRLSGDAVARALDAELGRGRIRSTRFTLADEAGAVVVRGTGHGHGVGLCQAGAARRARDGADRTAILGAYFPGDRVGRVLQP
jgi:stage II sporulation protein D